MTRMVKDWIEQNADEMQVAPHRYRWDETTDEESGTSWLKAKRAAPYKVGEVVFVEHNGEARKAFVYVVTAERSRWGDYREVYKVQLATDKGTFHKVWRYAHPGHVQRGYYLAGRAPDLEGKM